MRSYRQQARNDLAYGTCLCPPSNAYEITGGVDDGFVVTNIHSPETINLSGSKTWNDNDDEQGRRPESITIRLHADGKEIDSRTVTEDDEWKWNFPNLPKRNHGKEIDYTITEDAIPRYVTEIDGMDVTNTPICGPDEALYMVEFYYQVEGQYPTEPDYSEQRVGKLAETVKATEDDLTPQKERHVLDDDAENILEGVVKDDDSLVLRVYFKPWFVITYDPNGGKFADGGAKPIDEQHYYGETISIHAAPTRSEHDFLYWKGSAYRPGDSYTVIGDHTFVAQWAKKFIPRTDIPQLGGSVACVAGVLAAATGAFLGLRYLRGRHED